MGRDVSVHLDDLKPAEHKPQSIIEMIDLYYLCFHGTGLSKPARMYSLKFKLY